MKIGIIGATGKAGQFITKEVIKKGFDVTAIVRNVSKLSQEIPAIEKEVFTLTKEDVQAFNVVVNAFGAPIGEEHLHVEAGKHLIDIFTGIDTKLIVVGGAGSLFVDSEKTTRVVDTPDFPDFVIPTATNQFQNLKDLQASSIHWTFVSPSAFFDPEGPRTGNYTLGTDFLLVNEQGESYVSYADFAVALVDEIANPKHENKRFTVGSSK